MIHQSATVFLLNGVKPENQQLIADHEEDYDDCEAEEQVEAIVMNRDQINLEFYVVGKL